MAEETQATHQPPRAENHAGAMLNPEQHLLSAHGMSIQLQGKEGSNGHAVWALVKEDKGKVKTLKVHEGTRLEAATHFFNYVHPDKGATAPPPPRYRSAAPSQSRPRAPQRPSRPSGPPSRPSGPPSRPSGPPSRPPAR